MPDGIDIKLFIGSYLILIGGSTLIITESLVFYLKKIEETNQTSSGVTFNWYTWPILAANTFFVKFFGPRGTGILGLVTWRSIGVTFLFSLVANLFCVIIILRSIPPNAPNFSLDSIKILVLSHFVFVLFNFLGDLFSVSITRHAVDMMAKYREKYITYLLFDFSGIILGYIITLAPTIIAVIYAIQAEININQLIHTGLLGNALIPFFLLIFATSGQPLPFMIFALVAVFSITIPTGIYLFLTGFINFARLVKIVLTRTNNELLLKILYRLKRISQVFMTIGSILTAICAIL